jgi:FkbM family methyltransferase
MSKINYLQKLGYYSYKEWFSIIKFSLGTLMNSTVPVGLRGCHNLLNVLLSRGIKPERKDSMMVFEFPVNSKLYKFELKRNSSDPLVFNQIILNEEYRNIANYMIQRGIDCKSMIDAGSNIGLTSLFFNSLFPRMKIIALEPSSDTFKRLSRNIINSKVETIKLLNRTFRDRLDWGFRLIESDIVGTDAIQVISIQDIIDEQGLDCIDFLKIDIEGAEVNVFDETYSLEWLKKVRIIALEIHDEFNCKTIIESHLTNYGFELQYSGELTIGINNSLHMNDEN